MYTTVSDASHLSSSKHDTVVILLRQRFSPGVPRCYSTNFCRYENTRKQTATDNFRMGTRGNAKKGKTQKQMDRWSKTEHDKPWTERRGY
jgi:hypothetical protein